MSILRKYPFKKPKLGNFSEPEENIFEFCEGAEDMEVIKTKLEKGEPVNMRRTLNTSEYMSEEDMNNFKPNEILDITDVPNIKELQDKINKQNQVKEE